MKKIYFPLIVIVLTLSVILLENCKKKDNEYQDIYLTRPVDTLAFTEDEKALIMEGDSADLMRVLTIHTIVYDSVNATYDTITNYADSITLRKKCKNVKPDSNDVILQRLIDRLYTTVNDPNHPGVGIAAPQVGINRNVILVQRMDKPGDPFEAYLNPVITAYTDKMIVFNYDGCLSIPGISGRTDRYAAICIEYDLIDGSHHSEVVQGYSVSDFTAIIFQHEIDHLNGILFIDRIHQNTKLMNSQEYEEFLKTIEKPVVLE
ncbi:MAG: hypothetical protein Kow0068_04420 [Marinilabiliales bacterium]